MNNTFSRNIFNHTPQMLKNIFVSIIGLKKEKERYGKIFSEFYKFLLKKQKSGWKDMRDYRDSKLKELINYSYQNVPYYRKKFNDLGIEPCKIKEKGDLRNLPYLTKDKIIERKDDFLAENYKKSELLPMETSGTTGAGLKFFVTKEAWQKEYAFLWARRRTGVKRGMKRITFNGRRIIPHNQSSPPFWVKNYASNQVLFSIFHINENTLPYYIEALNKLNYKYIEGYPSSLYIIADYILENGIHLKLYPEYIYTSSETLYDWQRETIEKAFNCRVYDSYGTTELTSLITECKYENYHLNFEYGITEFEEIDRNNNLVKYEIISTGLLNKAFPLIRYRIGDYVLVDENIKSCKCNRPGPVIKRIEGRTDDIIMTPEGNKIGRLDHIFKEMENIKECQIVQNSRDKLIIRIVKRNTYSQKDENKLLKKLKMRLGEGFNYEFRYVDSIPRTESGKFRAVISNME